jgi:hypothetical protein
VLEKEELAMALAAMANLSTAILFSTFHTFNQYAGKTTKNLPVKRRLVVPLSYSVVCSWLFIGY